MSRRFVSLADGSKKLTKLVNKLHLSAKEHIRLPINHWLIGRRNCKVHLKKKRCFSSIASCLTTGMRFQTNGFKASRLVSQLACVFKPMVLRPLVASHNWHARLRLWKNQWLMWCFAVSLLNRFLKPMVLRPLVASHNWHARLSLIDTMAFLTTNGFKASDPSAQSHWYYGLSYNQWF